MNLFKEILIRSIEKMKIDVSLLCEASHNMDNE